MPDRLRRYHKKRAFERTPEPRGAAKRALRSSKPSFVVQLHRASHLHYDFRLEIGGVLASWAVPKGPSLDPRDKRLAMHVEDHPLEYASFEGVIPEGNYGAGEVIVWDRGTYEMLEDVDAAKAVAKGSLKFKMHGRKLKGAFALVKMHPKNGDDRAWLLIKERDEYVDARWSAAAHPESVVSGKTLRDVANARKAKQWLSNRSNGKGRTKKRLAQVAEPPSDVTITHPEKVLWPADKLTKAQLAAYYRAVAPWLVPHLEHRPLTVERFPDGIGKGGFFEKNAPRGIPEWVRTEAVRGADGRTTRYIVCDDERTLQYLANIASLTLHVWTSRIESLDRPDFVFFDLDPSDGCTLKTLAEVALGVRSTLEDISLRPVVKTSGGSGLHVIVPLEPEYDYATVQRFGELIAQAVAQLCGDAVSLERSLKKRTRGSVYFDNVQIGKGKTMVAAFSPRARDGAPISMPLRWEEVEAFARSRARDTSAVFARWNVKNAPAVLKRYGDPWQRVYKPQRLEAARKAARRVWGYPSR